MSKYTYSVIIPHRNTPDLLERCLDSIPERADIQVLVIDDICTTCASADLFIDSLKKAGADVVMAMFLAKTRRCWS